MDTEKAKLADEILQLLRTLIVYKGTELLTPTSFRLGWRGHGKMPKTHFTCELCGVTSLELEINSPIHTCIYPEFYDKFVKYFEG